MAARIISALSVLTWVIVTLFSVSLTPSLAQRCRDRSSNCLANPCRGTICPNVPSARCIPDYCQGACGVTFFRRGTQLSLADCGMAGSSRGSVISSQRSSTSRSRSGQGRATRRQDIQQQRSRMSQLEDDQRQRRKINDGNARPTQRARYSNSRFRNRLSRMNRFGRVSRTGLLRRPQRTLGAFGDVLDTLMVP